MSVAHDDFFSKERPWSRIKNSILGSYMVPYLAKVSKRQQGIVLVDAFAGPGKMADGSSGSPLLIGSSAEKYASGKYQAYFFNKNEKHHAQLSSIIDAQGWSSCTTIHGDAITRLRDLILTLTDETLLLYIDPFGLDCEFDVIRPLLIRDKRLSTEILINVSMPITHRLAGRNAEPKTAADRQRLLNNRDKLTRTYGGSYWRDALFSAGDTKAREAELIRQYRAKLQATGYLNFTGACPVRERSDSATKYYMVFASPHEHAMLLMNDNMFTAFNKYMHDQWVKNTLFADSSYSELRDPSRIQGIVLDYIDRFPDRTRIEIWIEIMKSNFMLFTSGEFKSAVGMLHKSGRIQCTTPIVRGGVRPTKRLNDNCKFKIAQPKTMF